MRQLDLSGFAPEPPPPSDPDPNAAVIDGTLAQALNNDFIARQQQLLHDGPDAFYQMQGADALAAAPGVLDQLGGLRNRLLDTTTSSRQRQILSQALDNHLIASKASVARHVAQQTSTWRDATAQNRLALLQKQAGFDYGNPDSIANYADAGRSVALHQAEIAGLASDSGDRERRASNAASAIWRTAIETALAKDDLKPAIALYERSADTLAPGDRAALSPLIGAAHERDIAQEYVAAIAPMAYAPGTDADIDAAHEEASERNAEDWNHDPELQATIQHFLDVLFGNLKRNLAKGEAERSAALDDWLNKPGPDGHLQTELPPLALWTQLDPDRQQAVRSTLANNAWDTRSPRSLIVPVSDADDEEEKEREREKERLRKLEHLPPPDDDIEASPVRDLPLPPAAPAPVRSPEAAPKPVARSPNHVLRDRRRRRPSSLPPAAKNCDSSSPIILDCRRSSHPIPWRRLLDCAISLGTPSSIFMDHAVAPSRTASARNTNWTKITTECGHPKGSQFQTRSPIPNS